LKIERRRRDDLEKKGLMVGETYISQGEERGISSESITKGGNHLQSTSRSGTSAQFM